MDKTGKDLKQLRIRLDPISDEETLAGSLVEFILKDVCLQPKRVGIFNEFPEINAETYAKKLEEVVRYLGFEELKAKRVIILTAKKLFKEIDRRMVENGARVMIILPHAINVPLMELAALRYLGLFEAQ